jgi:hypothetical protein
MHDGARVSGLGSSQAGVVISTEAEAQEERFLGRRF